jgi:hypothetical protein
MAGLKPSVMRLPKHQTWSWGGPLMRVRKSEETISVPRGMGKSCHDTDVDSRHSRGTVPSFFAATAQSVGRGRFQTCPI